jgi:alkyl hydroperoxide reductase subunit AhpF
VIVEQRHLGHERIQGDRARVVADHERAADIRNVLHAAGLDSEPLSVERAQRLHQHLVGELGIEAEVVDLVVAGEPIGDELTKIAIVVDLLIVNDLMRLRPRIADQSCRL